MSDQFALFGRDLFGNEITQRKSGPLAERFEMPPLSVFNVRDGAWQERKRAWLSLGIKSEEGRTCAGANSWNDLSTNPRAAESTRKIAAVGDKATIFDPTLCELVYHWFCPRAGQIVDPFAGGSVRGIVAGLLGYRYHGIELRPEQVAANAEQLEQIAHGKPVTWVCGDAAVELPNAPRADFVFSCPPYGDLERYSDDPRDLSSMTHAEFLRAYRDIISKAVARLKVDRFACFVVGDYRDKRSGNYRGFVADTVRAFSDAGSELYNDAVLVTAVGSLPLRVGKQFAAGRKLGKTHQNVLLFVKGDGRKAANACGVFQ